jgi:hypothetical protein
MKSALIDAATTIRDMSQTSMPKIEVKRFTPSAKAPGNEHGRFEKVKVANSGDMGMVPLVVLT